MKQLVLITALFFTQLSFGQACKTCYEFATLSIDCYQYPSYSEAVAAPCPTGAFLLANSPVSCGGFSGFCTSISLVPVELSSFKGEAINKTVLLSWITASETMNEGFEIERSSNGRDWEFVSFVKGTGSTSETKKYAYTDTNIFGSQFYYRIKQIDESGDFSYSQILKVSFSDVNGAKFSVFPNPVAENVVIENATGELKIYNQNGQLVKTQSLNASTSAVELSELNSGLYIIKITDDNGMILSKAIIKQ